MKNKTKIELKNTIDVHIDDHYLESHTLKVFGRKLYQSELDLVAVEIMEDLPFFVLSKVNKIMKLVDF